MKLITYIQNLFSSGEVTEQDEIAAFQIRQNLTKTGMSRRDFLRGTILGTGVVVASPVLAKVDLLLKPSPEYFIQSGNGPVLIPMLRRAIPEMMAFDICGIQPMMEPSGLIFS